MNTRDPAASESRLGTTAHPGHAPWRARAWLEPLILLVITAVFLWQGINHTPFIDEMFHVLAAESLGEDGDLRLVEGGRPYERAYVYTLLAAAAIGIAGEASLVAARVPAYVFGVLLVVLTFLWLRRYAGSLAAWCGSLLLLLSPITLYLSQQARFYTLQALAFLGVVILAQRLLEGGLGRRAAALLGLALIPAILLSLHLQITSAIGLLALAVWAGLVLLMSGGASRRLRAGVILLGLTVGLVAVLTLLADVGPLPRYWRTFRTPDLWSEASADNYKYYFRLFRGRTPVLVALLPAAIVAVLRGNLRFGLLLSTLFLVPVGIHSFAGWKSERYIFYTYPFFAGLNGWALALLLRWLLQPFREGGDVRVPRWAAVGAPAAGAVGLVGMLMLTNPAFRLTARMATVADADWEYGTSYRGQPDWGRAAPHLRPRVEAGAYVAASSALKAEYYLDRIDAVLMKNEVDHGELGIYSILAVPALSEPASVELLVACIPRGLIIIDDQHWGARHGVPPATAETVARLTEPVPLPADVRLRAFEWSRPDAPADPAACAPLLRPAGDTR